MILWKEKDGTGHGEVSRRNALNGLRMRRKRKALLRMTKGIEVVREGL